VGGSDGVTIRRWAHVSSALLSEGKIVMLQQLLRLTVDEVFFLISDGEELATGLVGERESGGGHAELAGSDGAHGLEALRQAEVPEVGGEGSEGGVMGEKGGTGCVERSAGKLGWRRCLLYLVPEAYIQGLLSTVTLLHQLGLPLFPGTQASRDVAAQRLARILIECLSDVNVVNPGIKEVVRSCILSSCCAVVRVPWMLPAPPDSRAPCLRRPCCQC
jgi:hypothetical protein